MLKSIWIALLTTLLVAIAWLRLNDFSASKKWVNPQLSRKIIHIGTGPLFVLCWLLFPVNPYSRYLAALVPALITIQFALIGFGIIKDQSAIDAMSRSGDRKEILQGPLYYGLIIVFITIYYWDSSPIGIIGFMLMCGGDGLADILGRKYGKRKLAWNPTKSWMGSFGMFLGGWVCSYFILLVFLHFGKFTGGAIDYLAPLTLIAIIGTLVESLPLKYIDNITVPIAALIAGNFLFR